MRLATFHQLRSAVQSNASPGRPHEVRAAADQLCDLLSYHRFFDWFEVETTDDPDRLVIAMCHVNADTPDVVVAQTVEAIWANGLLRPSWGAHAVILDDGHVELEGATLGSDRGHYVTVHLLATKSRMPAQRRPVGRHLATGADTQTLEVARSSAFS